MTECDVNCYGLCKSVMCVLWDDISPLVHVCLCVCVCVCCTLCRFFLIETQVHSLKIVVLIIMLVIDYRPHNLVYSYCLHLQKLQDIMSASQPPQPGPSGNAATSTQNRPRPAAQAPSEKDTKTPPKMTKNLSTSARR